MLITLWDLDPDMVLCWTQRLGRYAGITFGVGDLLRARVDAVVSPANSAGFMDEGIDLAYRNSFGLGIQASVQRLIEARYAGTVPVGAAALVAHAPGLARATGRHRVESRSGSFTPKRP